MKPVNSLPARTFIYVAEGEVSLNSGMGRVAYFWKQEIERRGHRFIAIGSKEVTPRYYWQFPWLAKKYVDRLGIQPDAFIVHEPAAAMFLSYRVPVFLCSHGVESRAWEKTLQHENIPFKSKITYPLLRLRQSDKGLAKAHKLLLISQEDCRYVKEKFHRKDESIFLFRNGYAPESLRTESADPQPKPAKDVTILFLGSWIARKGIHTLTEAAQLMKKKGYTPGWMLAGTGKVAAAVMNDWPPELRQKLTVIPTFDASQEQRIIRASDIFVLPSYFEGQPLSLIQSMASGKCCITTNGCGQKDWIRHGENGLLFESGNAAQLAELLISCLNDNYRRSQLGNQAKRSVAAYTWDKVSREVVDYLEASLAEYAHTHENYPAYQ